MFFTHQKAQASSRPEVLRYPTPMTYTHALALSVSSFLERKISQFSGSKATAFNNITGAML